MTTPVSGETWGLTAFAAVTSRGQTACGRRVTTSSATITSWSWAPTACPVRLTTPWLAARTASPARTTTNDDQLNLGPDKKIGTADDNKVVVEPQGNSLQGPGRSVTLSGSSSADSNGRSVRSYSWQQICLHPDVFLTHKLVALPAAAAGPRLLRR